MNALMAKRRGRDALLRDPGCVCVEGLFPRLPMPAAASCGDMALVHAL
jgi:hypothetical protein